MDFAAASVLPLKRYAEFRGRSTRTELIAFYVLTTVIVLAADFVVSGLGQDDVRPWLEGSLAAIFLVPTLALFARRLHDAGLRGWWLLLGLPLVVGGIWELIARPRPFTTHIDLHFPWWVLIPLFLCGLALFVLLLWDDEVDTNRYGPNPRGWTPGEPA